MDPFVTLRELERCLAHASFDLDNALLLKDKGNIAEAQARYDQVKEQRDYLARHPEHLCMGEFMLNRENMI